MVFFLGGVGRDGIALRPGIGILGRIENVTNDPLELMQALLFVWLFVTIAEEVIFRGFLMAEISKLISTGLAALTMNVVSKSIVFGFCHAYQNTSGIKTTWLIGTLFCIIFLKCGKILWVVILAHGTFDTIALLAIYSGTDKLLNRLIWNPSSL